MCQWTFESAETVAPVKENPTTLPAIPDPELLVAPSGGQPVPTAAIVEFTSVIAGASDLLQPLRAACEALSVVLKRAEVSICLPPSVPLFAYLKKCAEYRSCKRGPGSTHQAAQVSPRHCQE
jgi:hypothetical protein